MGSKTLMAAPSWTERYQFELARFNSTRHNIGKRQILHQQGFDVHISGLIYRRADLRSGRKTGRHEAPSSRDLLHAVAWSGTEHTERQARSAPEPKPS